MSRPFSQACENNKEPIFEVMRRVFADRKKVLEIGSGTGQHAAAFATRLPALSWQTSDLIAHHPGIHQWIEASGVPNLLLPLALDVADLPWSLGGGEADDEAAECEGLNDTVDAVFTANTLHIMSWSHVQSFFKGLSSVLSEDGILMVYGPFNYDGKYTSASNARFDQWLKDRDPASGIRDIEAVNTLASEIGLELSEDNEMPANNRLLVWQRAG